MHLDRDLLGIALDDYVHGVGSALALDLHLVLIPSLHRNRAAVAVQQKRGVRNRGEILLNCFTERRIRSRAKDARDRQERGPASATSERRFGLLHQNSSSSHRITDSKKRLCCSRFSESCMTASGSSGCAATKFRNTSLEEFSSC